MHKLVRFCVAVFLLAAVLGTGVVLGQRKELAKTTPEQRAKIQTDLMKSILSLKDDQLDQVAKINQEFAEKADPLLKGSEGDLTLMKQMNALDKEKDTELQKVLTSEQFETYGKNKKEIMKKMEAELQDSAQTPQEG